MITPKLLVFLLETLMLLIFMDSVKDNIKAQWWIFQEKVMETITIANKDCLKIVAQIT